MSATPRGASHDVQDWARHLAGGFEVKKLESVLHFGRFNDAICHCCSAMQFSGRESFSTNNE